MPSETATQVRHYRLVRRLGIGGMGEVYLAQDTELERPVALKILSAELACDENQRKRFRSEAKSASRLVHPNVCVIHDVGEAEDGRPFLAMEFVDGQTLDQVLVQRRLRIRETISIAIDVAGALEAAHGYNLVHRDIKPGNIMLDRNGRAKVLDFGLAKRFGEDHLSSASSAAQTRTGMLIGTPHYMSPEQALGREVDARTDIFGLGAVLYEMVSGQKPFRGKTVGEVINNVVNQEPEPLGLENPIYSPGLDGIIFKCLEKEPGNRYPTAKDLLQDLAGLRESSEKAATLTQAGLAQSTNNGVKDRQPTKLWKAVSRTSKQNTFGVLAIAAGLVGLLVLGGVAVFRAYLQPEASRTARSGITGDVIPGKSVAVLPFDNISAEPDTDYLSDGFTEEITSALSRIAGLKVAARNSAFAFKGKREDIRKVGETLRVSTVLEGSVRKVGRQVRVTAQLVNVADGFHLWSETYDRPIDDMLAVQEEIARRIAGRLQGKDSADMVQHKSTEPAAHKLYMQARVFWNKRTEPGLKEAVRLFQEAIKEDPNYADAHAGLAASYLLIPIYSLAKQSDYESLARASANRALELDPASAEAHAVLAQLQARAKDLKGAEEHYRLAIKLNPNYATAYHWYGQYLAFHGRREEGLQQLKAAVEIDPLSPVIRTTIPEWYYYGGDYDRAVDESRKVVTAFPDFALARGMLIQGLTAKGAYQEALDETEKARALVPDRPDDFLDHKGFLLARLGREDEARRLLEEVRQKGSKDRPIDGLAFYVYLGLRDYESAIAALERLADAGMLQGWEFKMASWYNEIKDNPRCQALCKKLEEKG